MRILLSCAAVSMTALLAQPAAAVNIDLSASLVNSCTLTINSAGVMTPASSGTRIGSEESGGNGATFTVVAVGLTPTVNFAAPSLVASPSGWSGSPVNEIRYTSTGGANQAYTSSATNAALSVLLDSFSVHGRVSNSAGFAAGNYTLRTVVTCTQ